MAIANGTYTVIGGFDVTQAGYTSSDAVTVTAGVFKDSSLSGDNQYVTVAGASASSGITYTDTGYKRIDLVVYETSATYTKGFKVIKGTQVLTANTALVPGVTTSTQIPLATIPVTASAVGRRVDVRDTRSYLPVRAFNRSENVRIGKQKVGQSGNTYVDLNDPVSRKELAYHSSIGAIYAAGSVTSSNNDFAINTGSTPTVSTFSTPALTVAVAAGEIYNNDNGTIITLSSGTPATATLAGTGNLRVDLVVVNNISKAYRVQAGTAWNATTGTPSAPVSSVTEYETIIAAVLVPATASANTDFAVIDIRPTAGA